jgi:hypothetical protein
MVTRVYTLLPINSCFVTLKRRQKMKPLKFRKTAAFLAVGVFVLSMIFSTELSVQTPAVDPAATKILKHTIDYLGSLKQFS